MDVAGPRLSLAYYTAIAAASFLAYSNTFTNGFVWDDASSFLRHGTVQQPSRFVQLFREDQHAYGRGQGNFYRPLVATSFMADYAIARKPHADTGLRGDPGPFVFHVQSVAWHAAAACLLALLLTRLSVPPFPAAALAAIYALHPLHTETVAYISGRADSMAAAFMLAALGLVLSDSRRVPYTVRTSLSIVCFAAALLSKESAFIYPVLLFLCLVFDARVKGERLKPSRLVPFFASLFALGAYAFLRVTVLNFSAEASQTPRSFSARAVDSMQALAEYVKLMCYPSALHMERSLDGFSTLHTLAGVVATLALTTGILLSVRYHRWRMALGLSWFVVTWLPISGLFPLNAPMAEHWMYVPLMGLVIAAADWITLPLVARPVFRMIGVAAAAGWIGFLLFTTVHRNRDWRDNESIYAATLRANPESLRVRYNLAVTYEDLIGNSVGAQREYARSIQQYQALTPPPAQDSELYLAMIESRLSLGRLYQQSGDYAGAERQYAALSPVPVTPASKGVLAEAALGLGQLYLATGNQDQAREQFQRAVQLEPKMSAIVRQLSGAS